MYNYQNYNSNYLQNPQFGREFQQPMQNPQTYPQYTQYAQPTIRNISLQGKIVDSIDVVKAQEISLDGAVNYYPLADGSAIVTKQLQNDGTSKIMVYKPIEEEKMEEKTKYVTNDDLEQKISDLFSKDIKDIKEEVKQLKRQFKAFKVDNDEKDDD